MSFNFLFKGGSIIFPLKNSVYLYVCVCVCGGGGGGGGVARAANGSMPVAFTHI